MFFLFLFLCLILIIGVALTLAGLIISNHKHFIKTGLIICSVPFLITIIPIFFGSIFSLFKVKPSQRRLIGEYQIVEVRNLKFDKTTFNRYKLVFKSDSTFTLTPTPYIGVCSSGKYGVDYSIENNELSYRCGKGYIMGHIERRLNSYRIEFRIGDPDSEKSIYFGKNNE